jgi:hypothetical protein
LVEEEYSAISLSLPLKSKLYVCFNGKHPMSLISESPALKVMMYGILILTHGTKDKQ